MTKQSELHKVDLWGLALASLFTIITLCVMATGVYRQHVTQIENATAVKTERLAAATGVNSTVAIRTDKLSSRNIDLLSIDPGPWMSFVATWYSPLGGEGNGLTTYTGKHVADDWTAAVDPRVIPLGSILEVKFADGTTQVLQATDTGGAIKGRRLDIFQPSEWKCERNGKQAVMLRILVKGGH